MTASAILWRAFLDRALEVTRYRLVRIMRWGVDEGDVTKPPQSRDAVLFYMAGNRKILALVMGGFVPVAAIVYLIFKSNGLRACQRRG